MTRVLFVCLGNICRSPMAEGLFRHRAAERGLAHQFVFDSAGLVDHHVGETAHPRTLKRLAAAGISLNHRGRQVEAADGERFDWILAMDASNVVGLRRVLPPSGFERVRKALDGTGGGDVPDPYYGTEADYDHVFRLLDRAAGAWFERWSAP